MEDDKVVIKFRYHIDITLTDAKLARELYVKLSKELFDGKYGEFKGIGLSEESIKILHPGGVDLGRQEID